MAIITRDRMIKLLQESPVFGTLSQNSVLALADKLEPQMIRGSETLMEEGEPGDCMYIVFQGRLKVFSKKPGQSKIIIGEIGGGSIVGEMALLTNEIRQATVVAIRDTVLLKLSKNDFQQLRIEHTDILDAINDFCILRLSRTQSRSSNNVAKTKTIAIIPSDDRYKEFHFIDKVVSQFHQYGKTLHLDSSVIDQHETREELIAWLNEQEQDYDFIIYEADADLTGWTKRCLRQSDLIVNLVSNNGSYELTPAEQYAQEINAYKDRFSALTILYYDHQDRPHDTINFLKARQNSMHLNLKVCDETHIARLARIISGNGVGVVLSGGGARGFAHLGYLQLLRENNIPIDYIAGTSMGGIIAAAYCITQDLDEAKKMILEDAPKIAKLDYTLPLTSIIQGKKSAITLQKRCGIEKNIEDLWLPMFCVSTSLTTNDIFVHKSGLLWQALRATISLPGIFPPIKIDRHMLVDGGILNNIPIDVMRKMIHGGTIFASQINSKQEMPEYTNNDGYLSGWHIFKQKYLKRNKAYYAPNLSSLVVQCLLISASKHADTAADFADYHVVLDVKGFSLMGFDKVKEIIDTGYAEAQKKLKQQIDDYKASQKQ